MKVSVIIPCYNHGEYIAQALDSVIAQTYSDWECIVVNDGSTDNSEQIIKQYADKDTRIKYLPIENSGVCVARNKAIELCGGGYVLPLDSDDEIAPEYIELALTAFEQNPELKLVYCQAELFGAQTGAWKLAPYSYELLLKGNMIFCSAMYRKSDFMKINGGYDVALKYGLEDWEFWLNFLDCNSKVFVIPKTLFRYRIKPVSRNIDLNKALNKRIITLDYIFMKHYHKYTGVMNPIRLYEHQERIMARHRLTAEYKVGALLLKPFRLVQRLLKNKSQTQ